VLLPCELESVLFECSTLPPLEASPFPDMSPLDLSMFFDWLLPLSSETTLLLSRFLPPFEASPFPVLVPAEDECVLESLPTLERLLLEARFLPPF
jgi:hypothetical protein